MNCCADISANLHTANVLVSEQKEVFIISYNNYMQTAKIKMTMIEYIRLHFLTLLVFFYLKVAYIIEAGVF